MQANIDQTIAITPMTISNEILLDNTIILQLYFNKLFDIN